MGDEATFSIKLASDAAPVSKEAAAALEELRVKALAAEQAVKNGSAALRGLRGSSDEVKGAKEKLKASIDAERTAFSAANLAILKSGSSLGALQTAHRSAAKAASDSKGEHEGLNMGLLKLLGVSREARMKISELGSGFKASELATAGLVAGLLAVAAGVVYMTSKIVEGGIALVKWIAISADANRTLALNREWIAGSAADSARMGDQIDRLRGKIPKTTEELSKLYVETRKSLDGARISGEGILNVVEAVAQASAAGSEAAASKINEIIARGKETGRVGINLGRGQGAKGELAGTGIEGAEVVKNLAANLKISLDDARSMLLRGRAPIESAALAIKQASEKAFGEINERKLYSLDAISKKLHDDWSSLTKGVNLESFWRTLYKIENVFSTSTTSGYALKKIIETIGNTFGIVGTKDGPLVETAIRRIILEAAKLRVTFLQWELSMLRAGKGDFGVVTKLKEAWTWAKEVYAVLEKIADIAGKVSEFAYTGGGNAALDHAREVGVSRGELAGEGAPTSAGRLATSRTGFVQAPGHADGGVVGKPAPGEAFASVAPGETIVPAGARGSRGGGGAISVNVTLTVNASGKEPQDIAAAVAKSSFVDDLTKALQDALQSDGVPTLMDPA